MIRARIPTLALLGLLTLAPLPMHSARAQAPDGTTVMEIFKGQERTADTSVEVDMVLVDERGRQRHRSVTLNTKTDADGEQKTLIRFTAPADIAGTGYLSLPGPGDDSESWLYLPALRRTRRIAGKDRTDAFMGTDFTYEDLEDERLASFTYQLLGTELVDGVSAWVIEALPSGKGDSAETGYSKRQLWVSKDHALLLKARFWDMDGMLVKELHGEDPSEVPDSGKWRIHRMTLENLEDGSSTILLFKDFRLDTGLTDALFSQRILRRGGF